MAVIAAQGLGKTYGARTAVRDLSFDVAPGSVTGFLGPNGAGKSTTMRLMLGLDHGEGTTTFDGRRFTELAEPMRHVGTLLEAKPFHPTRTARNHLRMLAAAHRIPVRRVDEVLDHLGLASVARRRPGTFSLGMGQRLGLAAALLGDPHTLILDEPANGLDPQGISWIRQLLQGFAAGGRSVLVSSHLLSEMALMADQLVVIGRGELIASGPVAEFVRRSRRTTVEVSSPTPERLVALLTAAGGTVEPVEEPIASTPGGSLAVSGLSAPRIGDLAHEHGVVLHQLADRVATLEEAFLDATGAAEEFAAHPLEGGSA